MRDDAELHSRCVIAESIFTSIVPRMNLDDEKLQAPLTFENSMRSLHQLHAEVTHPAAEEYLEGLTTQLKDSLRKNGTLDGDEFAVASADPVKSKIVPLLTALRLLPNDAAEALRNRLQQGLIDHTEHCLLNSSREEKDAVFLILEAAVLGQFGTLGESDRVAVLLALAVANIAQASPAESQPIGNALDRLEQAETHNKTNPSLTLEALVHLLRGRAYLKRHDGDRADDIEKALNSISHGLESVNCAIHSKRRAIAQMELGTAYSERISGKREQNLQKAIECYEHALQVFDEKNTPTQWAHTHINLGNVYQWLTLGDIAENQRLAATNYHIALRVLDQEATPLPWMVATMNLASLLLWQTDGGRSNNIETAIELYHSLSGALTGEGTEYDRAFIDFNLGVAHVERLQGNRVTNLTAATRFMEAALDTVTLSVSPHQHAVWKLNLAAAYQHLFTYDRSRIEVLETAIRLGTECLEIEDLQADKRNYARLNNNLGVAYKDLATHHDPQSWDTAERFLLTASELMKEFDASIEFQQPLIELADLHLRKHEWEQAVDYATAATNYIESTSLNEAMTDSARHQVFGRISEVSSIEAYSRLRLEQVDAAIATLENGRARQMSEALHVEQASVTEGAFTGPIDNEWLRAHLPEKKTLVLIVSTMVGGAAILIRRTKDNACATSVIWLNELSQYRIEELLGETDPDSNDKGWIPSYRMAFGDESDHDMQVRQRWQTAGETTLSPAYRKWSAMVESRCDALWQIAMDPIDRALVASGAEPNSDIVLLPPGTLSLLPLHAARNRTTNGSALCFGDLWSISYAPSLKSLAASMRRMSKHSEPSRTLLAIADPQMEQCELSPLPGAREELEALRVFFDDGNRHLLTGSEATRHAVLSALTEANYVHASCHGRYNWDEPRQSGLALANGEWLTLSDLIDNAELGRNRLFFASACETGFKDLERSPDEFVGISAGLMQAGAPNVIGTLWPVFDDAAFLLCRQFYKALFEEGSSTFDNPAKALRSAQAWLRDVTFGFLAEEFGTVDVDGKTLINLTYVNRAAVFSSRLSDPTRANASKLTVTTSTRDVVANNATGQSFFIPMGALDDKPYESPHEWAAYCVYGP